MTIEKNLERIADALEAIAAGGGTIPQPAEEPAKPAKKKTGTSKKQTVGKVAEPDPDGPTKEEVRAKLQAVQKATTPAQAKSILKAEGATTIGNLAVSKYPAVIAACEKIIDE
jgi:hypothetical protein